MLVEVSVWHLECISPTVSCDLAQSLQLVFKFIELVILALVIDHYLGVVLTVVILLYFSIIFGLSSGSLPWLVLISLVLGVLGGRGGRRFHLFQNVEAWEASGLAGLFLFNLFDFVFQPLVILFDVSYLLVFVEYDFLYLGYLHLAL